jgi:HAD superfamily hydrolase (TIGR01509 family)
MKTMRKIEGVFFDLGDTLLNFGRVDLQDLFRQGSAQAYEYLSGLGNKLPSFGRYRFGHMMAIRWHVVVSMLTGREFNAKDVLEKLNRRMGLSLSNAQLLEVCWQWYEPLHRRAHTEPGLADMLAKFRRDGLSLAVVSNTFIPAESLDRHLAKEGLLDLLPVRIYSCQIGRRKPHRSVFEVALRKTGLAADKVVFVGDSPRADILGAGRMGMVTVLKAGQARGNMARCRADYRIGSILELPEIIATCQGS